MCTYCLHLCPSQLSFLPGPNDSYLSAFVVTDRVLTPLSDFSPYPNSDDWTKFTDYRGYEVNDEVIQWFWKCVRSWPPERKSRLLQFATGTSRIPVNGFKDLQGSDGPRRFTIEKSGDPSQLPKSHTCFNRIDLPPYKDYATLEAKLTLAVECVPLFFGWLGDYSLTDFLTGRRSDSDRSKKRPYVCFLVSCFVLVFLLLLLLSCLFSEI